MDVCVPSAHRAVSESLGERIVVDLQLRYLFVLVGGDGDERRLCEGERVEDVPSHAEDVVRLDDVNAWLVFMHRVQYYLHTMTRKHQMLVIGCSSSRLYAFLPHISITIIFNFMRETIILVTNS